MDIKSKNKKNGYVESETLQMYFDTWKILF